MFTTEVDLIPENAVPMCGYGLAWDGGLIDVPTQTELYDAQRALPFSWAESDDAVIQVNRNAAIGYYRVPFEAWAEELGLVPVRK